MKFYFLFTCFFLSFVGLQLSFAGAGRAQTSVSFTGKDVPLEQVFASVKKQTGYTFVYYSDVLQGAHKVTINVRDLPIQQFLDVCLKDEPLTYKVVGQTVMIARKEAKPELLSAGEDPAVSIIKGRVTNEKGEPLAGASVMVKGSRKGTVTGVDGKFALKGVNPGVVLIISYAGFTQKEILVEKSLDLSCVLTPSNSPLDEAKVIAYGTTTDRLNTGDVTTVKAEDIEKQPVENPLLALEGRVPGLFITQDNGLPGSGIVVQIRGQNSLNSGTDPFYVIDGVPYASQLVPNLGGVLGESGAPSQYGGQSAGNPLNYINPADIESISVLKDAAATAIYGSRAANGAILITTKRGKAGQTKVEFNLQNGWGQVGRKLSVMNLPQYLQMRHEALNNDGITPSLSNGDYDLLLWDTTRKTDGQKTLIGGTAQYTNLSASTSGGNSSCQYLFGATFHRQTSVFPRDFADQKGSVHFNINSTSTNQRFKFQFSGNYMIDNNRLPNQDLTGYAVTLAPDAPPLYNSDGTLNWAPNASGASTWDNPLAYQYITYSNKTYNLISNAVLSYQVAKGLEVKANFGYTDQQVNENQLTPLLSIAPENRATATTSALYGDNNSNSWIIEPEATYKTTISKGTLQVLAGLTFNRLNNNGQQLVGTGYNSDAVLADIHSAAHVVVQSTTNSVYKYDAGFGRLSYNWQDKYLVDVSTRRDGSSRFGPESQFHNFYAVGAGWIFSQENFIKNNMPWLSFGKLRASYGTTGNDQIGNYTFLNLYSPIVPGVPYQGASGLGPSGLSNPYLEWEETKKLEYGIELGTLKDRILLNASYYQNRSSNQLLGYALPLITGFGQVTENFPAKLQNGGLEFMLTTTNVRTKDFTWTTRLNISRNDNKLIAFTNLSTSSYKYAYIIGRPVNIQHTFQYLGVNPGTGLYQFSDGKGGTTSTPDTNYIATATAIVNPNPSYFGGLENIFHYKQFELDVFFQFAKQIGQNYFFGSFIPGAFDGGQANQPTYLLNRWRHLGDIATHELYNSDYSVSEQYSDATSSNAAWSDASYIRLKNLSFSWQLPSDWKKGMHLQNASIYFRGQNLMTITHYKGLDPETRSSNTLPPLRILTFGLQMGF